MIEKENENENEIKHIYIARGYTDLRKGIDGLMGIIKQQYECEVYANSLFLFCGRRSDRMKALYWEGNGFILMYKRLEEGRFQWPRREEKIQELTRQEYRWLMEGLCIEQRRALKPVKGLQLH